MVGTDIEPLLVAMEILGKHVRVSFMALAELYALGPGKLDSCVFLFGVREKAGACRTIGHL